MSNYRQLHSRMWSSDNWFIELKPEFKLLFIYLFSNERASVCGLYELPIRIISFETGLDQDTISRGLEVFDKADKAKYDFETGVVWVQNMLKYQGSSSPKLQARIKADLKSVPDCVLKSEAIRYISDTVSIVYAEGKDTSYSFSVSSSVSEGEGMGEGEVIPETPAQAMEHPDILAFQKVCSRIPGQRDYAVVIETIQFLRKKHGDQLDETLKPYWLAWSTRKTKDHKPYNPSSLVWLCEWAVNGQIPQANGSEPKPSASPAINYSAIDATKQMLAQKDTIKKSAPPPNSRPQLAINELTKQKGIRK